MDKFVIICGPSGSGKTMFARKFVEQYQGCGMTFLPNLLTQVTTRAKRTTESEEDYIFLTKNQYTVLSDILVGKTQFSDGRLLNPASLTKTAGAIHLTPNNTTGD